MSPLGMAKTALHLLQGEWTSPGARRWKCCRRHRGPPPPLFQLAIDFAASDKASPSDDVFADSAVDAISAIARRARRAAHRRVDGGDLQPLFARVVAAAQHCADLTVRLAAARAVARAIANSSSAVAAGAAGGGASRQAAVVPPPRPSASSTRGSGCPTTMSPGSGAHAFSRRCWRAAGRGRAQLAFHGRRKRDAALLPVVVVTVTTAPAPSPPSASSESSPRSTTQQTALSWPLPAPKSKMLTPPSSPLASPPVAELTKETVTRVSTADVVAGTAPEASAPTSPALRPRTPLPATSLAPQSPASTPSRSSCCLRHRSRREEQPPPSPPRRN